MRRGDARRWGQSTDGTTAPASAWARSGGLLGSVLAVALALALFTPSRTYAERLRFSSLTVEGGLSDSWVRSILKDDRGFLWFGTRDGLSRYDGYAFRVYRHVSDDPHSLTSSDIWTVLEDSKKRLWIGGTGLDLYDRDHDRFERYLPDPQADASPPPAIRTMCEDRRGQLWLGSQNGLVRFDPTTRSATSFFRHDPHDPTSVPLGPVLTLACDRDGTVWIGTTTGLDRHDEGADGFRHVLGAIDDAPQPMGLAIRSIYVHPDGALWLATLGEGLVRLDSRTGEVRRYVAKPHDPTSIRENRIMTVSGDGGTTIYAGGEHGLHVLDTRTGRFSHSVPDPDDPSSLTSASIWSLLVDDQAILWIGTFNGGVNALSAQGQRFGLIRAGHGGLSDSHVLAILEDHTGSLWIGTDGGGLDRLDRKTGRFVRYRHDPANPAGLGSDSVLTLAEDSRHQIWIGMWSGGLQRLDPQTGRFAPPVLVGETPADGNIATVLEDSRGELLVGTVFSGACRLDRRTGACQPLAQVYPGLTTSGINVIAEDRQGDLWLGLGDPDVGGADHVARATGRVTALRHDPGDPNTISRGAVTTIYPDSQGNVWIGTDYGGLNVIENGTGRMRHYTTADGLPTNAIAHILEDEDGSLWISTTKGLARFEHGVRLPDTPRIQTFDIHDGLQGNEFRRGAGFKSRSGELFFGGQRGLTYFRPGAIHRNPKAPPVVLTDLKLFNRPVTIGAAGSPLTRAITETPALTLSYRQSVVTFEFAALNFLAPEKNQYAYKLEGFDKAWNEVGTRRTAPYTNLPPGDFVLRVRASNNDGVWNEQGVALPIHITPPFWRTRWFSAAVLVMLLTSAGVAYRLRVRHHVRVARELRARIDEATAQIKTLHGLLPICSWCKKVRDDSGYWNQIEEYVRDRTQAEFSHGICPDCRARYFPMHPSAQTGEAETGDRGA